MKKQCRKIIAIAATSGLLACFGKTYGQGSGTPFAPGVPIVLNITATAIVQNDDTTSGTVTKSTTTTKKLTNKSILSLTGEPAGSLLVYQNGEVDVVNPKTGEIIDTAPITVTIGDTSVWSGAFDSNTGAETYTGSFTIEIAFDDGSGDSFDVVGLGTEKYTISKPNKNGVQTVSDSITLNFSGVGSEADANGVLSGNLTGSGKGTL
jgi:hypothetical protein